MALIQKTDVPLLWHIKHTRETSETAGGVVRSPHICSYQTLIIITVEDHKCHVLGRVIKLSDFKMQSVNESPVIRIAR